MQTIQFVLALAIGWFLAAHDLSLPWIAFWTIPPHRQSSRSPPWWSNTGRFPRLRGAVVG